MSASDERKAVRLLWALMNDTLSNWRANPVGLTATEQDVRQFLLERQRHAKSEAQA